MGVMVIEEIQLEISSRCNSRCSMCLKKDDMRQQGYMSFKLAKRAIDQSGAKSLKASWFGESLMSPNFKKIVRYAKKKGLYVFLFTNGTLIDWQMGKFLKEYVDKVFLSVDDIGFQYENIRKGLRFSDFLKGFDNIREHNNLILTSLSFSEKQVWRMKTYFKDYNLTFSKIVNRYKKNKNKRKIVCGHNVDKRLVVGWDGKCYLCCQDWLGKYPIGDLKKQSIDKIWDGEKRLNLINNLKNLEICQNCME